MIILAGIMLIFALASMFLFRGSILTGVIMILCAGAVLFVKLIFSKKIKSIITFAVYGGCMVLFLVCAMCGKSRSSGYGLAEYAKRIALAQEAMEDEDYKEALDILDTMEKELGATDAEKLLKTEAFLESGDIQSALGVLGSMDDQASAEYYLHLAACYDKMQGGLDALKDTLIKGADAHPENLVLNYKAGCMAANSGEYVKANYYLMRAYVLCPVSNGHVPYVLAALRYDTGDFEEAYAYMQLAELTGILEEKERKEDPVTIWYLEKKQEGSYE